MVLGSAPREITRGAKAIRKRWKKSLAKEPAMAVQGEVRASVTPDRAIGWVCANVDLGASDKEAVPHRSFYVYQRADQIWQLIAAQEAVVAAGK